MMLMPHVLSGDHVHFAAHGVLSHVLSVLRVIVYDYVSSRELHCWLET